MIWIKSKNSWGLEKMTFWRQNGLLLLQVNKNFVVKNSILKKSLNVSVKYLIQYLYKVRKKIKKSVWFCIFLPKTLSIESFFFKDIGLNGIWSRDKPVFLVHDIHPKNDTLIFKNISTCRQIWNLYVCWYNIKLKRLLINFIFINWWILLELLMSMRQ